MKILSILSVLILGASSANALPIHAKNASFESFVAQTQMNADYNFDGIVKLSNCSGALVRFEHSKDSDKGMMLTNGHCFETGPFGGMMEANSFVYNKKASRSVKFLNKDGSMKSGSVSTTVALYGTMTGTDVTLYELDTSFADISKKFGVAALTIDSKRPTEGQEIDILSGYWQKGYSCKIDGFVFQLKEDAYTSTDSMRYSKDGCHTIHGTSGSPIVNRNTGLIVGINNTGNDAGEKCTMDNPCEVSQDGTIFAEKGLSYGQQTYIFYSCLNSAGKIDLSVSGCKLFHGKKK
jgi:V8-like Glu-specific endopeptidase